MTASIFSIGIKYCTSNVNRIQMVYLPSQTSFVLLYVRIIAGLLL